MSVMGLMNWKSCEVSNMISLRKAISNLLSRGASTRAKNKAQDILQVFTGPFEYNHGEYGRIERVSGGGGGRQLSRAGRRRGSRKSSKSDSRLVAITSGETYLEGGIP